MPRPPLSGALASLQGDAGVWVGAAYLAVLVLSPLLGAGSLAAAALAAAAATAWLAYRRGAGPVSAPWRLPLLALAWMPVHLAVMAAPREALLVLPALWAALVVAIAGPRKRAVLLGGAVALLAISALYTPARLSLLAMVALAAGALAGTLVARHVPGAAAPARASASRADAAPVQDPAPAIARMRALPTPPDADEPRWALQGVAENMGARRMLLWELDLDALRATAVLAVGGAAPPPVALEGDPLLWAAREGVPLRLEEAPRWAPDAARAALAPVARSGHRATLYSAEFGPDGELPDPERLREVAVYLGNFLRMRRREEEAWGREELYRSVVDLLRRLPRELEVRALGRALASAGVQLAGGTGALVGTWDGVAVSGRVVAVVGEDGGPAEGDVFLPLQSELAIAVRAGATLTRHGRWRSGGLPLAVESERWSSPPRALAVLPLADPSGEVVGVLALWSSREGELRQDGQAVLETLAPYAALQLRHALQYGTLQHQVLEDALTGLRNRRAFDDRLAEESARQERYMRALALLMLDVDHFKAVNDQHGHEAGDEVLRRVAAVLRGSVRSTDVAARYGGEEFAVLLPETGLRQAAEAAERIRAGVAALRLTAGGQPLDIRVSVGVAAVPESVADARDLVGCADAMLYEAKRAGRDRVRVAGRNEPRPEERNPRGGLG